MPTKIGPHFRFPTLAIATSAGLAFWLCGCRDGSEKANRTATTATPDEPPAITFVPNPGIETTSVTLAGEPNGDQLAIEAIKKRLDETILPSVEFADTPLVDALEFLQQRAAELSPKTTSELFSQTESTLEEAGGAAPQGNDSFGFEGNASGFEGNDFVPLPFEEDTMPRITLRLSNVPLGEALRYVSSLASLTYRIEPGGIVFEPITYGDPDTFTRVYSVPSDFLTRSQPTETRSPPLDPFGDVLAKTTPSPAQDFLESAGISFQTATYAHFDPKTNTLEVRNTEDQLELVEAFLKSLERDP